jgi:D-aminoacyl-tRNA deacylase
LNLKKWKNLELPLESGFSAARESTDGKFRLVDIEEIHVFQDGLDRNLKQQDFQLLL